MKKRNKIIAGLVIGGAIASVLGLKISKKDDTNLSSPVDDSETLKKRDEMLRPKRKGLILRLLDWLENK